MKGHIKKLLVVCIGSLFIAACNNDQPPSVTSLKTVSEPVDLRRYAGTWYEIAKIPNRFQKHCVRNTRAEYQIRDDGRIHVTNSCVDRKGEWDRAEGVARIVDLATNAKLEVSFVKLFGQSLFWGDYWIIALGDAYEYAVVGSPGRKYGWILSRTPNLPDAKLHELFERVRVSGYDPQKFETTLHD